MKKLITTTAIIFTAAISLEAKADSHSQERNGYIEGSAGLSNAWDNQIATVGPQYNNGINLNLKAGQYYDDVIGDSDIRGEIEGSYIDNDFDNISGDVTIYAGMVNGYYDFNNSSKITPYVGLGVGAAFVEAQSSSFTDDEQTVFAYQGMLGAAYEYDNDIDLTMGYKYFNANSVEIGNRKEDMERNNIEFGVRLKY